MYGRSSNYIFATSFMEPDDEDVFNRDPILDQDHDFDFIEGDIGLGDEQELSDFRPIQDVVYKKAKLSLEHPRDHNLGLVHDGLGSQEQASPVNREEN